VVREDLRLRILNLGNRPWGIGRKANHGFDGIPQNPARFAYSRPNLSKNDNT
jgi:hypothetical protein